MEQVPNNRSYQELILNAITHGIALIDAQYRIQYANPAMPRTGDKVGGIEGLPCYQTFDDHDTICPDCPATETFQTGQVAHVTRRYTPPLSPIVVHMLPRTPIRVVVADDHPLIREGIIASLGKAEDIRVVGEVRNGEEAVMLVTNLRPDVVLIDLDMPTMDGVAAIRVLMERFPALKILVLSAYEDAQHVYTAMQAGAVGYVIKRTNQASLLNLIRSAHNGEILISPYLARLTLKDLETPSSHPGIHLTSREKEVLNLIMGGHENDAIAEALAMSRDTLKTHLKHVFQKLQVKNRTQAAVKALEKGILPVKKN